MTRKVRLAAVAMLAAGCTLAPPTPTTLPAPASPSTAPSASPPSLDPTQPPTTGRIGAHWEFVRLGPQSAALDAVNSDVGWVAVGTTCPDAGCTEHVAGAWTSPDGFEWTAAPVVDRSDATLGDVAWNGAAFYALGNRVVADADGTLQSSAGVWRALDGSDWRPTSSIALGPRGGDGPWAHGLAASRGRGLIVAGIDYANAGLGGALTSPDGATWTHVGGSPAGMRGSNANALDVIAADPGFVLAGACVGCPVRVWSSADGITWASVGTTAGMPQSISMATDGARLVLAQTECSIDTCATSIWSGPAGGQLTQSGPDLDLVEAYLAFTGTSGFLLVGRAPVGARVLTSADGLSWAEQPNDLRLGDCVLNGLAGGPGEALLLGCNGVWVSRGGA